MLGYHQGQIRPGSVEEVRLGKVRISSVFVWLVK
jgi:hypothetical protein